MLWILVAVAASILFYWKIVKPHSYWKDLGVKQSKPTILFGDGMKNLCRQQSLGDMVNELYKLYPKDRYNGVYQFLKPFLLIRDPELIRQIAIKDFDHFSDHVGIIPDNYDPMWTKNLFSLKGERWRDMRATLSPAFTSSKMRAMFALMCECADDFVSHFEELNEKELQLELKDTFTRFTNDVIATCAFGIKCNSMKEKENEFYVMGKKATNFTGLWTSIKMVMYLVLPKLCSIFGLTLFPKVIGDFFQKLVTDSIKMREEKNIVRPDMIHLLMEARKGRLVYEEPSSEKDTGFATVEESEIGKVVKKQKEEITDIDITAQALIFFFAGFDSVATLMCFLGHELAVNPDIQQTLVNEINDTLEACNGKLTYEALNKMKYMDMVVAETLRMWPAASIVDRACTKAYTIPPMTPDEVPINMKPGDSIWIPIWGIHRDPNYYPNPNTFDPERFNDRNKHDIKPYTYLPFGTGPRNCIGSRFALLETKLVFFYLLSKFEMVVIDKTCVPLELSKNAGFTLLAKGGFWVGLRPRK